MTLECREEIPADREAIFGIHSAAFGREGEARLVDALRAGGYVRLSLLALKEDCAVGHILYSALPVEMSRGTMELLSLAPVAVQPDVQCQGVGSLLIQNSLRICAELGHRAVVVLGEPEYYGRFGFSAALAQPLKCPFSGPYLQARELLAGGLQGVSGNLKYPSPFFEL